MTASPVFRAQAPRNRQPEQVADADPWDIIIMLAQRQQLLIDPNFCLSPDRAFASPSPISSLYESPPDDMPSSATTPISARDSPVICYALCIFDFASTDPDHLPFRKNELLIIVQQEESGWWAALRGDRIGWVPKSFLVPLSTDMYKRLLTVHEELRLYDFNAESLYNMAPVTSLHHFDGSSPASDLSMSHDEWVASGRPEDRTPFMQIVSPTGLVSEVDLPDDVDAFASQVHSHSRSHSHSHGITASYESADSLSYYSSSTDSELDSPADNSASTSVNVLCPPSPSTPMPHPVTSKIAPLAINKPTPATPTPKDTYTTVTPSPTPASPRAGLSRSRSDSAPSAYANRNARRRPIMLNDYSSLSRLSVYIESPDPVADEVFTTSDLYRTFEDEVAVRSPTKRANSNKIKQLTGDDDAQAFHNAKLAQANMAWYLRPGYSDASIKIEFDGSVRAATVDALVEHLTVKPLKANQEIQFRHTFLTTFPTFATADQIFDLLIEQYEMDHPSGLSTEEFEDWKERKLRPVQKRVLDIFSMWLTDHHLLRDDPQLVPRLRDFLGLINAPQSLTVIAKRLIIQLERLTTDSHPLPPIPVTPNKRRKTHKNDLLRIEPIEIAQQLTLYEQRLYAKIKSRECLQWAKSQKGEMVANLSAYCATHDRLASWVKLSVLVHDGIGRRADTINHWIKVAEKCRTLNNYSSMSAIVAALSSAVLSRLQLTWAHSGRESHLEPLARLNEPMGNFSAYRGLLQATTPPCVPFIGPYLMDIVHLQDQMKDTFANSRSLPLSASAPPSSHPHTHSHGHSHSHSHSASASTSSINSSPSLSSSSNHSNRSSTPSSTPSSTSSHTSNPNPQPPHNPLTPHGPTLINFVKRQKWHDAVTAILRFQSKPYTLPENPQTISFIDAGLQSAAQKDQGWFWTRSQELQQSEANHADIRKGLEEAGF